jgi:dolichol-phosphate mannosyltransferase
MIYFLIPVLNEEENVESLISSLDSISKDIKENYRILFVNDGSDDGTSQIILNKMESFPIEMLENSVNEGPGPSFEKGFKHFIEIANKEDIVVTIEGDNTGDLSVLSKMLSEIRNGKDFALASCYAKGGKLNNLSFERKFFSKAANYLCMILFRIPGARTYSSFYRAFSQPTISQVYSKFEHSVITERGFVCMVELLIKLHKSGFTFAEVPATLFFDKRKGTSKLKINSTVKSYLRLFMKFLLSKKTFSQKDSK